MVSELHKTNVNLDGILEVLGENLYSSPSVAIRELIQNSYDGCIRSSIEEKDDRDNEIILNCYPQKKELTITDNGSGLTYDEIIKYLATIGSGYTKLLRKNTDTEQAIGMFGLGFLTAYVIASRVDVITTSYKNPSETWCFSSQNGSNFSIKKTALKHPVGTTVKLKLKEDYEGLSSESFLSGLVNKHCCFLPIPIKLGKSKKQVNDLLIPWRLAEDAPLSAQLKAKNDLASFFENNFQPLCSHLVPKNEYDIKGLLWIHDSSTYSTSDYRNMNVFVRNMRISDQVRDLLPNWAGFIGCAIDTTMLKPTASREDLVKDENYYLVKSYLKKAIISMLIEIAKNQPEMWRSILRRHNQPLMGAAINEDELFLSLQDALKVPTSRGELNLPSLVSSSQRAIYIKNSKVNDHESILLKSKGVPIVSGYFFAVSSFCQKYAEFNNLKCVYLGTNESLKELISESHVGESVKKKLQELFLKENEALVAASFQPGYIPMLFVEDLDAKLKKEIEDDDSDKKIGTAALMLAKMYTDTIDQLEPVKVIINIANPTVKMLVEQSPYKSKQAAAMMRSFMLSQCSDMDSLEINYSEEIKIFSESINDLLQV